MIRCGVWVKVRYEILFEHKMITMDSYLFSFSGFGCHSSCYTGPVCCVPCEWFGPVWRCCQLSCHTCYRMPQVSPLTHPLHSLHFTSLTSLTHSLTHPPTHPRTHCYYIQFDWTCPIIEYLLLPPHISIVPLIHYMYILSTYYWPDTFSFFQFRWSAWWWNLYWRSHRNHGWICHRKDSGKAVILPCSVPGLGFFRKKPISSRTPG